MNDKQLDKIKEIKALAQLLAVIDNNAPLTIDTINRVGDLIIDLSDDLIN